MRRRTLTAQRPAAAARLQSDSCDSSDDSDQEGVGIVTAERYSALGLRSALQSR